MAIHVQPEAFTRVDVRPRDRDHRPRVDAGRSFPPPWLCSTGSGERCVEADQRPPGQLPGEEGGRCSLQALAQAVQEELVQLVGTDPGQLDGFDLLLAQAGLAKISNRLGVLGPDLLEGSPGCPGGTAE